MRKPRSHTEARLSCSKQRPTYDQDDHSLRVRGGVWSHYSFENVVPIISKSALASRSVPSFCARLDSYKPLGKQVPVPFHTCNARSCCCRQPECHSSHVHCIFLDLITHPIWAPTTSPENTHLSSAWTTCCKIWSRKKDCMVVKHFCQQRPAGVPEVSLHTEGGKKESVMGSSITGWHLVHNLGSAGFYQI